MDESFRILQRQYEQGEISVIQWIRVLQRAGLPAHQMLIETWERLLANSSNNYEAVASTEESQYLYAALELLEAFPLQCTCEQCFSVSHNGFCTCCLTGICTPHRDGLSGPEKVMTTFGPACRTCAQSCQLNLPDKNWLHPGKLALEIIKTRMTGSGRQPVWTNCRGYHYERPDLGDEERTPIDECSGTIRQQILFMMRHAACRIDAGPPEERDEDLENWRDMLSELGPGEFPPY